MISQAKVEMLDKECCKKCNCKQQVKATKKSKTVFNVFDCNTLKILFESEDVNEADKRLAEEKAQGKDVIRGVKFEPLDYVLKQ